jgi:Rrf2 family transcriptional regulator, iron-sulfur cluster assembly transcription factor
MTEFGAAGAGVVLRAKDLARASNTPPAYVAKVLRRLAQHGLLTSCRGQGGGFALVGAPEQVRLLDVMIALGSWDDVKRCAFGKDVCDPRMPCSLHDAWLRLREALAGWAATTTVADIAALRRPKR